MNKKNSAEVVSSALKQKVVQLSQSFSIVKSLDELRSFANELTALARSERRLILLLDGPMGAGKTQLSRYLVEAMGSEETTSPSFSIHNSYQTSYGSVQHFDLYRLESEDDLESTGFWDFFREPEGLVLIEWASRLTELGFSSGLPVSWPKVRIHFSVADSVSQTRTLVIQAVE